MGFRLSETSLVLAEGPVLSFLVCGLSDAHCPREGESFLAEPSHPLCSQSAVPGRGLRGRWGSRDQGPKLGELQSWGTDSVPEHYSQCP